MEVLMKKKGWAMLSCLLMLAIILGFQECVAGVVIYQVMKDREGVTSNVAVFYSGERIRTDSEEGKLTTVMDFKEDRMLMIDHRSKKYVEVKLSHWEREMMDRIKKESHGVKPKAKKISVNKTGEKAVINGFQTEKIQVFADKELIEEDWMTRDVDLAEVEKAMERVAQGFSRDFKMEMYEGREIYENLKPYGFPILVKDYTMALGLPIDVVEVKRWERKNLGDDVFNPPKGYERIVTEPPKK
jgi:hypothetical protein